MIGSQIDTNIREFGLKIIKNLHSTRTPNSLDPQEG